MAVSNNLRSRSKSENKSADEERKRMNPPQIIKITLNGSNNYKNNHSFESLVKDDNNINEASEQEINLAEISTYTKYEIFIIRMWAMSCQFSYYIDYPWHRSCNADYFKQIESKPTKDRNYSEQISVCLSNQLWSLKTKIIPYGFIWFIYFSYVAFKYFMMTLLVSIHYNRQMELAIIKHQYHRNQMMWYQHLGEVTENKSFVLSTNNNWCGPGYEPECSQTNALWLLNLLFGDPLRNLGPTRIIMYSFWASSSIFTCLIGNFSLYRKSNLFNLEPLDLIYCPSQGLANCRLLIRKQVDLFFPLLRSVVPLADGRLSLRNTELTRSYSNSEWDSSKDDLINGCSPFISATQISTRSRTTTDQLVKTSNFNSSHPPRSQLLINKVGHLCQSHTPSMWGQAPWLAHPMTIRMRKRPSASPLFQNEPEDEGFDWDEREFPSLKKSPSSFKYLTYSTINTTKASETTDRVDSMKTGALDDLINYLPYAKCKRYHWSMKTHFVFNVVLTFVICFVILISLIWYLLSLMLTRSKMTTSDYYLDIIASIELLPYSILYGICILEIHAHLVMILCDQRCLIDQLRVNMEICVYLLQLRKGLLLKSSKHEPEHHHQSEYQDDNINSNSLECPLQNENGIIETIRHLQETDYYYVNICHPNGINKATLNEYFYLLKDSDYVIPPRVSEQQIPSKIWNNTNRDDVFVSNFNRGKGERSLVLASRCDVTRHKAYLKLLVAAANTGKQISKNQQQPNDEYNYKEDDHDNQGTTEHGKKEQEHEFTTDDLQQVVYEEKDETRSLNCVVSDLCQLEYHLNSLIDKMMDIVIVEMGAYTKQYTNSQHSVNIVINTWFYILTTLIVFCSRSFRYLTYVDKGSEIVSKGTFIILALCLAIINIMMIFTSAMKVKMDALYPLMFSMISLDYDLPRRKHWLTQIKSWYIPYCRFAYRAFNNAISYDFLLRTNLWVITALLMILSP